MKLKNKLIPLTTIASVAAVVAPIALTSCSYTLEGKVFDCTKPYSPTIKQAEEEVMGQLESIDTYTKAVLDNKQILIEDLMWSASSFGNTFDPYFFFSPILSDFSVVMYTYQSLISFPSSSKYSKDMKKFDNIGVSGKLITDGSGQQINTLLLSCDIQYSIELSTFTLSVLDSLLETDFVQQQYSAALEGVMHFDNVPCVIRMTALYDTAHNVMIYPHLSPFMSWMLEFEEFTEECGKWSIDLDQTITLSNADKVEYCPTTFTLSSDYKLNKDSCADTNSCEYLILELLFCSLFCSHYLGKIIYHS